MIYTLSLPVAPVCPFILSGTGPSPTLSRTSQFYIDPGPNPESVAGSADLETRPTADTFNRQTTGQLAVP